MAQGRLQIGTSGWQYSHWKGSFYPEKINNDEMLEFYARHFDTVEINNSFYQLPSEETLDEWRDESPKGFEFAVKASRYITHMKKLKDPEEGAGNFLDRVTRLKKKMGPILFQLPPKWKKNPERLEEFLKALPGKHRYAFEFRDPSWFDEEIYESLRRNNAAFCIYHLSGEQSPKEVTADFIYVRLHGPGEAYEGEYGKKGLSGWAGAIKAWRGEGKDVYVFFDNDQNGYAAKDALRLREMTG